MCHSKYRENFYISFSLKITGDYILLSGKDKKYMAKHDADHLVTSIVYQHLTSKTLLVLVTETL